MRISIIGPVFPYRGGIAHFTTMLSLKLMEQGHEVQVISFKKQYPKWLYPGKSDKDNGTGRKKVGAEFILSPFNPLRWSKAIRAIKAFNPDKILIQWWITFWGLALGFVSGKLRKPNCQVQYLIHNVLPHEEKWIDKGLARFALRQGCSFIVMSDKEIEKLTNLLKETPQIDLCPLPLFSVFPKVEISQNEAREKLKLSKHHKTCLFFGLVRPYKGLGDLISAFEILKIKGCNDIGLLVVGEFWEDKNSYLKEIETKNLVDRIWVIDRYVSDLEVAELFTACNLFVAPYIDGTQSASVKTALSFGIPLVITRCLVDELTKGKPFCRIVKEGSPEDLAEAILSMIDQPRWPINQVELVENSSWDQLLAIITKRNW